MRSAPRDLKKEEAEKENIGLEPHTHLQVRSCRGQSESSSGGGSGGRCP